MKERKKYERNICKERKKYICNKRLIFGGAVSLGAKNMIIHETMKLY